MREKERERKREREVEGNRERAIKEEANGHYCFKELSNQVRGCLLGYILSGGLFIGGTGL